MIDREKDNIFAEIRQSLQDKGFRIERVDLERPWGGFLVIDEKQVQQFAFMYFQGSQQLVLDPETRISGKILFVAPNKRLSWQYHDRRGEVWQVLRGQVGVVTSDTDEEHALRLLSSGEQILIPAGTRHRLVGLDKWGIVAEIWQHTNPGNPSDENDIVRLQDDFER